MKYRYSPYGVTTQELQESRPDKKVIENRYGFTGRELEDETGLYYYRARYYDPELGRFISEDPIGFSGGDVNLYGYVGNDPVNWIDPDGMERVGWEPSVGNCYFARKNHTRMKISVKNNLAEINQLHKNINSNMCDQDSQSAQQRIRALENVNREFSKDIQDNESDCGIILWGT